MVNLDPCLSTAVQADVSRHVNKHAVDTPIASIPRAVITVVVKKDIFFPAMVKIVRKVSKIM